MRTLLLIALFSAAAGSASAQTLEELEEAERGGQRGGALDRGPFGLGLIIGEPSGLSAKVFVSGPHGVQAHLGFGVGRRGFLVVIVDYLFHVTNLVPPIGDVGFLWPYAGIGGRLGVLERRNDEDVIFGVRIPLGASFGFNAVPIEVFAEFAVGIGLLPETRAIFDGGIGGRYYF